MFDFKGDGGVAFVRLLSTWDDSNIFGEVFLELLGNFLIN
jgi:hypothetical protein